MNALALRATTLPARRSGSGTAIKSGSGGVCTIFALVGFDPRTGVATYSLQVMNYTSARLVAQVWASCRNGKALLASPVVVEILPGSTLDTQIPVLPATLPRFERAIVEVTGEGIHCVVEAPPPAVKRRHTGYALAAASLVGGLLLVGVSTGINATLPRIEAFALPPQTLPGTTVRAEYQARGAGALSYSVVAPDGSTLQSGALHERSGSIPIAIPSGRQGAYTVELALNGPLGRVHEMRVLNTLFTKAPSGATIDNISVHPIAAHPGQTIRVSYSAAADGGYLRLMSDNGAIWAQQPFTKRGLTQFVVPPLTAGRELQVMLHVTKGSSSTQSIAGLVVAGPASTQTAPAPAPQILGDDDPNAATLTPGDANGTFDVLAKSVRSGTTIPVKIFSPRNGMRLSIMDEQSHEISGLAVGGDAQVVSLRAPVVRKATKFVVQASFTDGFGQETVVEPVTVAP